MVYIGDGSANERCKLIVAALTRMTSALKRARVWVNDSREPLTLKRARVWVNDPREPLADVWLRTNVFPSCWSGAVDEPKLVYAWMSDLLYRMSVYMPGRVIMICMHARTHARTLARSHTHVRMHLCTCVNVHTRV